MKYLVLVPARGGSKGVIKKNIYPICGKPMIQYTLDLLKNIKLSYDVIVSTDSDEIMSVAEEIIGEDERFYVVKRPDEFATDEASTEVVALHAVAYMESKFEKQYDALITMAPNLPLRTSQMFCNCIDSFERMEEEFDSQVCFLRTTDDYWRRMGNGEYVRLFPDAPRRRQEREPLYIEKGSMTISRISALKQTKSLWGKKVYGFEIEEENAVDIHDSDDIVFLEYLIGRKS